MEPGQLISYAKDRGVELSLAPNFELNVTAPKGLLTQEVVSFLKENKKSVVDQLCNYDFQNYVFRIIFSDDIAFVVKQVRYLGGRKRLEIVRRYLEEFDAGYSAEPNPVKKLNAGRYRANTWLHTLNS